MPEYEVVKCYPPENYIRDHTASPRMRTKVVAIVCTQALATKMCEELQNAETSPYVFYFNREERKQR